jgi:hypothetical protein
MGRMKPIYTNPCPFVMLSATLAEQDDLEPEVEHCAIFARVPTMSLRLAATPPTADAMALAADLVTRPWPPDLPGVLFEIFDRTRAWPVRAEVSDASELMREWWVVADRWNADRSEHLAKLAGRTLDGPIALPLERWGETEDMRLRHFLRLAQAGPSDSDNSRAAIGATGASRGLRLWWAWMTGVGS